MNADPPLSIRIPASLAALAIIWLLSAIAIGVYTSNFDGFFGALIWSVPFLALGWLLAGLPLVLASGRILRLPAYAVTAMGACGGIAAILVPFGILESISGGKVSTLEHLIRSPLFRWRLLGWPLFGASLGASAALIYYQLLKRACSSAFESEPGHSILG